MAHTVTPLVETSMADINFLPYIVIAQLSSYYVNNVSVLNMTPVARPINIHL